MVESLRRRNQTVLLIYYEVFKSLLTFASFILALVAWAHCLPTARTGCAVAMEKPPLFLDGRGELSLGSSPSSEGRASPRSF